MDKHKTHRSARAYLRLVTDDGAAIAPRMVTRARMACCLLAILAALVGPEIALDESSSVAYAQLRISTSLAALHRALGSSVVGNMRAAYMRVAREMSAAAVTQAYADALRSLSGAYVSALPLQPWMKSHLLAAQPQAIESDM